MYPDCCKFFDEEVKKNAIFDYHCKDCDREFGSIEVWESMKAEECVHCHSKNIEPPDSYQDPYQNELRHNTA